MSNELLHLLNFVPVLFYFVGICGHYKNPLYGMWIKIKLQFLAFYTTHVMLYGVVVYCVGCVVPGAGAFEVAVHNSLMSPAFLKDIKGRARLGVQVLLHAI